MKKLIERGNYGDLCCNLARVKLVKFKYAKICNKLW